jgi:hypothetical protein
MSTTGSERFAALTGALFVVVIVIAFAVFGGDTPVTSDSQQTILSFYQDHNTREQVAGLLLAAAAILFGAFTAVVSQIVRDSGGHGKLANLALLGGAVGTAGFLAAAGIHIALADAAHHAVANSGVVALNALDNYSFPGFAAGTVLFILATSWAAIRHGALPKWLAWVGIVISVLFFTPAGFFAFLASGLWILAASLVLTFSSRGKGESAGAEPEPAAV